MLQRTWTGGHVGIVRAALWDERVGLLSHSHEYKRIHGMLLQNNVLLTGGEDSKLNVWTAHQPEPVSSSGKIKRANDVDPMDIDEDGDVAARKKRRA